MTKDEAIKILEDWKQRWARLEIEHIRVKEINKELLEACKIALPFLQEYRERVIKGRIEGELLPGDYTITRMLRAAIEAAERRDE